ncbi:MAG: hypothetical protein ABIV06_02025 [Thermoanaerobaculia bacterium]
MPVQRLLPALAVVILAGCGGQPELPTPNAVVEQTGQVIRNLGRPPSEAQLQLFVGCYEVYLGERFPRPTDWPPRLALQLTAEPGDMQNWFRGASTDPWHVSLNWILWDERTVLLHWYQRFRGSVQLNLQLRQDGYSIRSLTKPYEIEAKSVKKVPCKVYSTD